MAAPRGVQTAIAALPRLTGAHLAVVGVPSTSTKPVDQLRELATPLEVDQRVHYLELAASTDVQGRTRCSNSSDRPDITTLCHVLQAPASGNKLEHRLFSHVSM